MSHENLRLTPDRPCSLRRMAPAGIQVHLSPEEAAARLGVSSSTLWRMVRRGDLKPVKVLGRTRFRVEDIEKLIEPEERE